MISWSPPSLLFSCRPMSHRSPLSFPPFFVIPRRAHFSFPLLIFSFLFSFLHLSHRQLLSALHSSPPCFFPHPVPFPHLSPFFIPWMIALGLSVDRSNPSPLFALRAPPIPRVGGRARFLLLRSERLSSPSPRS